jgi:hypothetical protein
MRSQGVSYNVTKATLLQLFTRTKFSVLFVWTTSPRSLQGVVLASADYYSVSKRSLKGEFDEVQLCFRKCSDSSLTTPA